MEPNTKKTLHTTLIVLLLTNAIVGFGDLLATGVILAHRTISTILATLATKVTFFGTIATQFEILFSKMTAHTHTLAVFYFVSHGVIKLFLVWALLKGKLWAYPLAIIFFSIFSAYQITTLIRGWTLFDFIVLLLNLFVLVLVIREYREVRAKFTLQGEMK